LSKPQAHPVTKKKQQLMQNAKATHLYMNEKGQRLSAIKSYDLENGNKREQDVNMKKKRMAIKQKK